jgi:hypothetical protein
MANLPRHDTQSLLYAYDHDWGNLAGYMKACHDLCAITYSLLFFPANI